MYSMKLINGKIDMNATWSMFSLIIGPSIRKLKLVIGDHWGLVRCVLYWKRGMFFEVF